jgi:predicted nucleic acid-binding protein
MNAVDTNVLLYVHDPRDPDKQTTAAALLQSLTDGVLLWQVACEYLSASRKLEPFGYNRAQAWLDIQDLRRVWTTILPRWMRSPFPCLPWATPSPPPLPGGKGAVDGPVLPQPQK